MLGRETIPAGEAEAIRRVVEASRAMLAAGDEGPSAAGQHAKHHGCVRAEFVVEPDLPDEYRVGLFREPKTYPAWVRFSNGAEDDDRKPDAHGMAVKLMGVDGPKVLDAERDATTHDFVMVDSPAFFLPDAAEYAEFTAAMLKAKGLQPSLVRSALGFLPGEAARPADPGPALLPPVPARRCSAGPKRSRASGSPTRSTPVLEHHALPLRRRPGDEVHRPSPTSLDARAPGRRAAADYLREAMAAHLATGDVVFEFQVQLQTDERSTPVEDPTVVWDEAVAPPQTVARIRIPAQEFGSRRADGVLREPVVHPLARLPEHRPLGGINRVRKDVYTELSPIRHEWNGVPSREPEPGGVI